MESLRISSRGISERLQELEVLFQHYLGLHRGDLLEKNGWKEFLAAAAVLGKEKEAIAILQRSQAEAPLIPDPVRAAYYLETVPSLAEVFTGILAPLFVETE